jgi:hypothetical protein
VLICQYYINQSLWNFKGFVSPVCHITRKHAEERTKTAGASIIKTPRRVKHNRKNWLHQYKQGGRMRDIDKWTTPQERKNFKNKNNNNFKNEILKQLILNRAILMSVSGVRLQCSW